jgi:hypothetical protein
MSKLDDLINSYQAEAKKINVEIDLELLTKVTKGLGPSIYNADSSKVACGDKDELDRVKASFLIKKLGLADDAKLDEALKDVCNIFGSSNKNKYRALFYYLLVKKFNKESVY